MNVLKRIMSEACRVISLSLSQTLRIEFISFVAKEFHGCSFGF